jgi:hypothetical protein
MQKQLSRRQALKTILAAGGGVTAASFIPSQWLKPVVRSGVLPVHAQASASNNSCGSMIETVFWLNSSTIMISAIILQTIYDAYDDDLYFNYFIDSSQAPSFTPGGLNAGKYPDGWVGYDEYRNVYLADDSDNDYPGGKVWFDDNALINDVTGTPTLMNSLRLQYWVTFGSDGPSDGPAYDPATEVEESVICGGITTFTNKKIWDSDHILGY